MAQPMVLFRAGRQLVKVRFIQLLSLGTLIGCLYAGWRVFETFGLNPADGYHGVLAPVLDRSLWAGGIVLLAVLFFGGMAYYGRCYVAEVAYEADRGVILVWKANLLFRSRVEVPVSEGLEAAGHAGGPSSADLSWETIFPSPVVTQVNAPWFSVRWPGSRHPMILDGRGDLLEPDLLDRLFHEGKYRRKKRR